MPRLTRAVPFIRPGTKKAPTATKLPPLRAKLPSARFVEFCRRFLTHAKGPLTGQPFIPAAWQVERIIRPLLDIRDKGRRRYRVCYWSCPRKSGKSTLAAALALFLLYCDDEGGAELVSAAGSADQAAIIFDTAKMMVERNEHLRAMAMVYRREIRLPSLGASYKVISAEAGTAHGLNLSACFVDELHVWPDRKLYDALVTSTGAREQPIIFIATTAGDDEHSICAEVHRHAEQVRDGIVEDPQLLPVIYAAPEGSDWQDEAVWHAANPALGDYRSLEEMRAAARQAKDVPGRESPFRRFYLNEWGTAAAARWLPLADWDLCAAAFAPERPGQRVFLGLDLASTRDLTALAIVRPDDDGGFDVRVEFWVPRDTIAERERTDRVPYRLWVDQGWLHATPGNSTDYSFIEHRVYALMAELDVQVLAADPWNGRDLLTRLTTNAVPVVEIPQTMPHLSTPSKALEKLILSHRIRHDNSPVLRWCVANCVADVDGAGNVKPSKKKSHEKIDGVSALVTALARALVEPASVYTERPPLLVEL